MRIKLTLQVEDELVKKAKQWAKTRRVSSEIVAQFFERLLSTVKHLESTLRPYKLVGVLRKHQVDDVTLHKQYIDHLEKKHQ